MLKLLINFLHTIDKATNHQQGFTIVERKCKVQQLFLGLTFMQN